MHIPSKTRRRFAISAAAFMLLSQASYAAEATLLTSAICDNPRDTIDYFWLKEKYNASDLFFMKDDNSVVFLTGTNANFNSHKNIFIAAHGNVGQIASFPIVQFILNFKTAHPDAPESVYFDSCNAAKGPNSNMKKFSAAYGDDVGRLEGPAGLCQLVGNGNPSLTDAAYKYDANQSDPVQFGQIVNNIKKDWKDKSNYQESGMSFKEVCDGLMTGFDGPQVLAFVNETYRYYTSTPVDPIDKTVNYLQLIKLNTGGKDFLVCGMDEQDPCP